MQVVRLILLKNHLLLSSAFLTFTVVSNLLFHEKSRNEMINATAPIIVTTNIVKYF